MFKKYVILTAVIVILCSGCAGITSTGGTSGGAHYPDEITLDEQKNVSLIVFRYGDKYIAKGANGAGWSEVDQAIGRN